MDRAKEAGSQALDSAKEKVESINNSLSLGPQQRTKHQHNLMASYSIIDTWLPGKIGASYAFHPSPKAAWEIEYLRGTLAIPFIIEDLGKVVDQRLSLLYRSFSDRNSFNFFYGLNYSSFTAHLGSDFLAAISGGNASQFDLFEIKTLGLSWGLGNRWHLENRLVLGIDWFTLNVPIYVLASKADFLLASADEGKKDDVRTALDYIESLPTFSILKLQLGWSF